MTWSKVQAGVYTNGTYTIFKDSYTPVFNEGEGGRKRVTYWDALDVGTEEVCWILVRNDRPDDNLWIGDTLAECKARV